jgi:iron complex transport system ATP-binding protein
VVLAGGTLRGVGKPHDVLTPELLREVFGVTARVGETLILGLP